MKSSKLKQWGERNIWKFQTSKFQTSLEGLRKYGTVPEIWIFFFLKASLREGKYFVGRKIFIFCVYWLLMDLGDKQGEKGWFVIRTSRRFLHFVLFFSESVKSEGVKTLIKEANHHKKLWSSLTPADLTWITTPTMLWRDITTTATPHSSVGALTP